MYTVYDCTYSQSAFPHELTDELCMAVRGEPKPTATTASTGAKTMNLNQEKNTIQP